MKIISYYLHDSGFWIRIFGHGIVVVDRTKIKEPFSIRMGIRKQIKIGKWGITIARKKRYEQ